MSEPQREQTGATEAPVCPRHPDRISYVRCQRCGRPTCPECQRPAPVGIQCVDCVAEAARRRPAVRTVLGGRDRGGRPVVTLTAIGICVALYLLQLLLPGQLSIRLVFAPSIGAQEPYRFLTSAFLHGSALHLAVNMYALWIVGSVVEPVLGRWRFAALYLLSALGGSVAVLLLAFPGALSWSTAVVGASGAVFGLFSAFFVVLRHLGRDARQILVLIAINFALGFVISNVSWQAHLGGAAVGALLAVGYVYGRREAVTVRSVLVTVLVGAALVAATVAKYALY